MQDFVEIATELKKKTTQAGSGGSPNKGQTVYVKYKGMFPDGKVFDQSGNDPFYFQIGLGQVIQGWDLGVASMKVGEKCQLICEPHMAYGDQGAGGVIPPKATLVFDVELLKFK